MSSSAEVRGALYDLVFAFAVHAEDDRMAGLEVRDHVAHQPFGTMTFNLVHRPGGERPGQVEGFLKATAGDLKEMSLNRPGCICRRTRDHADVARSPSPDLVHLSMMPF